MMLLVGVHSCAIAAFCAACTVVYARTLGAGIAVSFLATSVIFVFLGGFNELHIGTLLLRLADQQWATEQLLDHASDGFCSVSLPDCTILSASDKFVSVIQMSDES